MASATRRKRRDGTYAGKWSAVYTDERGRTRTRAGFSDKRETEKLARRLEDQAQRRRRGLIDDRDDRLAAHAKAAISGHVEAYDSHLRGKGGDDRHRRQTIGDIEAVVASCGWSTLKDLDSSPLVAHLHQYREKGRSARSVNARRQSIKGFSRWCVASGRLASDPLVGVPPFAEHTPTLVRRALDDGEIARLIEATEAGPVRIGLDGTTRSALYRTALGTGFRRAELDSLTPASFDLDGAPPTVTVEAAYSKHRKRDVQPIQQSLAEALRPFLADREPDKRLWPIRSRWTAQMLREDLEAAGVEVVDDGGRVVDFHALRGTYISRLNRAGVNIKVAQQLARHSTITLTMDVYAHVGLNDEVRALESVPDYTETEDVAALATGTDDAVGDVRATHAQHSTRTPTRSLAGVCKNESEGDSEGLSRKSLSGGDLCDTSRAVAGSRSNADGDGRTPNPSSETQRSSSSGSG